MYEKGQGVTRDFEKAVEFYLKAANQGNVNAQKNLGIHVLYIFFFFFNIYEKVVIRMRGVKLFIVLASSYFSAGPPLQYLHRSRV